MKNPMRLSTSKAWHTLFSQHSRLWANLLKMMNYRNIIKISTIYWRKLLPLFFYGVNDRSFISSSKHVFGSEFFTFPSLKAMCVLWKAHHRRPLQSITSDSFMSISSQPARHREASSLSTLFNSSGILYTVIFVSFYSIAHSMIQLCAGRNTL